MSATDELAPWWRRHPERLAWELANFADVGIEARAEQGSAGPVLQTALSLSDGTLVPIRVGFPVEYPIIAPSVHVESGLLGPPHEASGLLCLFDSPRNQWNPRRGVAELINGRVRALLEGELVAGGVESELEEQIPSLEYLRYESAKGQVVFVPDPFWGGLPSGIESGAIVMQGDGRRRLLRYAEGFEIAADLADRVDCGTGIGFGRWVALPGEPKDYLLPDQVLDLARATCPHLFEPVVFGRWRQPRLAGSRSTS
jgi:hypothetical protein